jgi:peptide/nickel transport system permease protein
MGLTLGYVVRRVLSFIVVVWAAASLNFLIPRLAPGDPITAVLNRMNMQGAYLEEQAELIEAYREMFGLNEPIYVQYLKYLRNMARFEMGYSLNYYPTPVKDIIARSLPWSVWLLTAATLIAFAIGITLGATMGWRGTPRLLRAFLPITTVFASIPSYLMALLLLYIFVFGLGWFPPALAYSHEVTPGFNWRFIKDVIHHAVMPISAVVIVSAGGWALGMRGMMISITNEDYLVLARAKGLSKARIFWRYAVRNAMLPQITALAMSLGGVVAGSTLVEVWFSYPGIGFTLYNAIRDTDYTLIQGITFIMVVATAGAVLIVDLIYPRLDPRITYQRR